MHNLCIEAFVHVVHVTNGLGEQHLCKVMYRSIGGQLELDD